MLFFTRRYPRTQNCPGLLIIDKPELKDDFINSLAAIEAAIVDDADEAARELKGQILEKLKYGHTPDQIRDAIGFVADCSNGHLRTVASGTYFIDDKALFDALEVSLKRMAELPRFNLLSAVYGLSKMDGSSADNWWREHPNMPRRKSP